MVPLALAGWGLALVMRPFVAAPGALNAGGVLLLASLLLAFAAADRRARARPARPPRLLRAALLHRPRRGCRRGPLLGRDDAVPAPRRPDPGRADVRLRRCCCSPGPRSRRCCPARRPGGADAPAPEPASWRRRCASSGLGLEGARRRAATRSRSRAPADRALATEILGEPSPTRATREADDGWRSRPTSGQTRTSRARTPTTTSSPTSEAEARGRRGRGRGRPATTSRRRPDADGQQAQTGSPSPRRSTTSCRRPRLLERGKGDPGPDMRDREAVAKALLEALRHFGVEAQAARESSAART